MNENNEQTTAAALKKHLSLIGGREVVGVEQGAVEAEATPVVAGLGEFAHHPKTLGEAAVARDEDASKWSPRDMLIKLLRDHDSGEAPLPEHMVVVLYDGEERLVDYYMASSLGGILMSGPVSTAADMLRGM